MVVSLSHHVTLSGKRLAEEVTLAQYKTQTLTGLTQSIKEQLQLVRGRRRTAPNQEPVTIKLEI